MGQLTSRQEILQTEVSDPEMRNWLYASMAIRETSQVLAKYVHTQISQMHKNMRRAIGASGPCKQNCSHKDEKNNVWCTSCDRWRKEILCVCNPQYKINWTRLNSSQWHANPYEVARAFIPRAHRLYYKSAEFHEDFRFSLSFIENCLLCSAPPLLCQKARQCQGRVKRKNLRMRMRDEDLQVTISVLTQLLALPELGQTEPVVHKLQLLQDLPDTSDGCKIM
ncbi:uncharacterized protein CXorf38 homolog [Physella acuta]|uniref:uncharacterized protein CXorf38 homolog n=1 Tax=Physella acuta TaxID=109671 RepID=UPI0027DB691A|nr:uncharacterized protein CXorf38 homolog [Physella acuta]XP_059160479.1 uncharacterized protein CXorf38 homolog [Physella acuta]XP_059160480.1 uncharacterized protein CXorf38 homolog [Physella acuta]